MDPNGVRRLVLGAVSNRAKVTKSINSTTSTVVKRINSKLKVAGVKAFTYEELAEATDNFSERHQIGQGGYGTVYVGKLHDGRQVAIKCADALSGQGTREFYTEIELLSRVHHKHLVTLEGYCDEDRHQVGHKPVNASLALHRLLFEQIMW